MEHKNTPLLLAKCKDHLVSHEQFSVVLDKASQIASTHPQPAAHLLPAYYQSDEYISHGTKQRSVFSLLYALIQKRMFGIKRQWLSNGTQQAPRYLDYGCGTGALVRYLTAKGWDAHGVEPNAKARKVFNNLKVVSSLGELTPAPFDVIGLWHVLEHVPNPTETLAELIDILTPQGKLFLALPNFNSYDAAFYSNEWAGYDVPRHLWHFSSHGIVQLCESLGLKHTKTNGMFFDAFYVSYLSEKHRRKCFPFVRGFFIGLWSNIRAKKTGEYSAMLYCFEKTN